MPRSQRQTHGPALIAVRIDTCAGIFTAHFSERGLAQLDFPNVPPTSCRHPTLELSERIHEWSALAKESLTAILSGATPRSLPPLDVSIGTYFQRRVWLALRGIPAGQTKSYGEIAAEIGSPNATRAVGGACGANPIPVLIPCHRVLASGGRLGGFSGGLDWKKRLLAAEGMINEQWLPPIDPGVSGRTMQFTFPLASTPR